MAPEQTVILYDSPEAAQFRTGLSGWFSRNGAYWGTDEHMARYGGCTHKKCETCDAVVAINSWCVPCRTVEQNAAFDALPLEKWDGLTPLALFDSDRYFFNEDVLDFITDQPVDAVIRIVKCRPQYLSLIDQDNWMDDLPEDGELPEAVAQKVAELNAAIKAAGPVSWFEDKIAIDVADLRLRAAPRHA